MYSINSEESYTSCKYSNISLCYDKEFQNKKYIESNFTNCTWEGIEQNNVVYKDCRFLGCNFDFGRLQEVKFINCHFNDIIFNGCTFYNVSFLEGSIFKQCAFERCEHAISKFEDCIINKDCLFMECTFKRGWFWETEIRNSRFNYCVFNNYFIVNSILHQTRFYFTDFEALFQIDKSIFSKNTLKKCKFHKKITTINLAIIDSEIIECTIPEKITKGIFISPFSLENDELSEITSLLPSPIIAPQKPVPKIQVIKNNKRAYLFCSLGA